MGLIFKSRGNASIGPFLIRIVIGLLFLTAGAQKVVDIEGFISSVQSLGIMPDNVAFIVGFILPFAQIILGGLYLIGLFTPIVSILLSFIIFGTLVSIGGGDASLPFSYNLVFLACTISTIFSGAGKLSFDALIDRDKKNRVIVSATTQPSFKREEEIKTEEVNPDEIIVETEEIKSDEKQNEKS